jgi:hypothetical protein
MKKSFGFWLLLAITIAAFFIAFLGNLSEKQTITTIAIIGGIWLIRYNDKHQEWLAETFSPSTNFSAEERTRIFQRETIFYLFNIQLGVAILVPLLIYIAANLK